jgi:hypothetical protein
VRIPQPVQQWVRPPEECRLLTEAHANPVQEHLRFADVRLVRAGGRIKGEQDNVVALPLEFRRQGVVAETTTAIHSGGAGCEREDSHKASEEGIVISPSLVRVRLVQVRGSVGREFSITGPFVPKP